MEVAPLEIPEVLLVTPVRHGDARGSFSETYRRDRFAAAGIAMEFVQNNHAISAVPGTVRGLHFQKPPHAQDKLVRVTRGSILDIAVDIRHGSPTFGKWVSAVLSAENGRQLLVPKGFAHGLCTLEPDTEVQYMVSDYYDAACDLGLAWDDPLVSIPWPVGALDAMLSDKDRRQPTLSALPTFFPMMGSRTRG